MVGQEEQEVSIVPLPPLPHPHPHPPFLSGVHCYMKP